jgi:hypothetical protein
MVLSVITVPIVLAQLIDFLIRRCHVNRKVILQIRSATPIQDMILALTYPIAERTKKRMPCKKFATLRLFVETMPICKAVASGNGNIEFYRETTRSNLK